MISIPRAVDAILHDDDLRFLLSILAESCDVAVSGQVAVNNAANLQSVFRRLIALSPAWRAHIARLRRIARLTVRHLMPNAHRIAFAELQRLKECVAEIDWILNPYSG